MKAATRIRRLTRWSIFLLVGIVLTACGEVRDATSQPDPVVQKQQPEPSETKQPSEPVSLVFYSTTNWSQEAFNERFGDTIRKKFPQYAVKYITIGKGTSLAEMVSTGAQMDVYWQSADTTINHLKEYKLEFDMSQLIKKHQIDLSALEPTSLQDAYQQSNGKLYALPVVMNTAGFYYNRDLFERFGVKEPKDGMSWDEIIELGKKFNRTEEGKRYSGIGYNFNQVVGLNAFSIPYVSGQTHRATILADDRWKTIFDTLYSAASMTSNSKMLSHTHFSVDQTVAMYAALANLFLNVDLSGIDWDMITYPTWPGQDPKLGPQTAPTTFGITSISKHPDEAMQVLKHLLSVEAQSDLSKRGVIPVLQDQQVIQAFGTDPKYRDKNLKAIIDKKFAPVSDKSHLGISSSTLYTKQFNEILVGSIDRNTAFRLIQEEVDKLIEEDKLKK